MRTPEEHFILVQCVMAALALHWMILNMVASQGSAEVGRVWGCWLGSVEVIMGKRSRCSLTSVVLSGFIHKIKGMGLDNPSSSKSLLFFVFSKCLSLYAPLNLGL